MRSGQSFTKEAFGSGSVAPWAKSEAPIPLPQHRWATSCYKAIQI
jgi:hypothetical protein